MSLFVFKIITLVVRTLAKPMIAWVTHYKKLALLQSKSDINLFWKNRLVNLGNKVDHFNSYINRKIFRLKPEPFKKLSDEKALERGAEFFSEVLIYSILISLPVIEYLRQTKSNAEIEFIREKGLRRMRNDIEQMLTDNIKVSKTIDNILKQVEEIEYELNHFEFKKLEEPEIKIPEGEIMKILNNKINNDNDESELKIPEGEVMKILNNTTNNQNNI